MTTEPKDLMTLEETISQLRHRLKNTNLSPEARELCESTIHHVEAGRNGCQCMEFNEAQQPCTDNEGYGALLRVWDGEWRIGSLSLNPIAFCPWCGGKVTTAPEVKG